MNYPPRPHVETDSAKIEALVRSRPFAHFFTAGSGMCVTRIPFAIDADEDGVRGLRAHLQASNPQCAALDGANVLVAFSGPDSYISPNWRTASDRGATWDYTAVHVWGRARVRTDRCFFDGLINDLAAAAEAKVCDLSDKPKWSMKNVTEEYVERLRPQLCAFEIAVTKVVGIAKLHRNFPDEDARSVAAHLASSPQEDGRAVGALIEQRVGR